MNVRHDQFDDIARYYDPIMEHVNYDRWFTIACALTELLPSQFLHLDAACGTCVLLKKALEAGWNSIGVDLSAAMLRTGRKESPSPNVSAADLCALPFSGTVDYITCLFDSVNFLLKTDELNEVFRQFHTAMSDDGLLYFDIVTERMVLDHFEGQNWTESNGRLTTTWSTDYNRDTCVAHTTIRVGTKTQTILRERIYTQRDVEKALKESGLILLGAFDAETWRKPNRKTLRIEFVAVKKDSKAMRKRLKTTWSFIASLLA